MNRKLFIKKLYSRLKWDLPLSEAEDIVSDYNEYFDEGLSLGKTESQLCAEFGSPKQIAANILNERGPVIGLIPGTLRKVIVILLVLFYPALIFWNDLYLLLSVELNRISYLYVAAAPVLMIIFTGVWPPAKKPVRISRRESLICGGLSLFLLLLAAVCSFLVYDFLTDMIATFPHHNVNSIYFVAYTCEISILVVAAAWLAVLLTASFKNVYTSCMHFLFASFLACVSEYLFIFSALNFEEESTAFIILEATFMPCVKLFATGVLCAAAVCILAGLFRRKSGNP